MSAAPIDGPMLEIPFSDADFHAVAGLAQARFGLNLSPSKKPLVRSRLAKRLRLRGIDSYGAYLALIDLPEEGAERQALVTALTTNVTSFFREAHHFDTLRAECLAPRADAIAAGQRLRLWSAGCSSGQEAYSIAMVVRDLLPEAARQDLRILATDIDPQIVARARRGSYAAEEAASIPAIHRRRWVESAAEEGRVTMAEPLRRLITFAELNLMEPWPFHGPFDAIFCRNVAIYFNKETQQRLWQRFARMLVPGGHLFIGHSERVTGPAAEALRPVGITSYQRAPETAKDPAPGPGPGPGPAD
jgi:chemotaxis protein methyltransferase CheR